MIQVGNETIYISNKYKIQIEPTQFEWDKFLPALEKDFPEILNEVLSCNNNQQQQQNLNENSSIPIKNRNQYNTVINNRTRMLTALSPSVAHTSRACGYQYISHSMPENNTYGRNGHLTNHTNQGFQNRKHYYHTAPFRSSHIDHDHCGFHHRRPTRSSNWFHNTYLCEYSNNVFHATNTTTSNLENTTKWQGHNL